MESILVIAVVVILCHLIFGESDPLEKIPTSEVGSHVGTVTVYKWNQSKVIYQQRFEEGYGAQQMANAYAKHALQIVKKMQGLHGKNPGVLEEGVRIIASTDRVDTKNSYPIKEHVESFWTEYLMEGSSKHW